MRMRELRLLIMMFGWRFVVSNWCAGLYLKVFYTKEQWKIEVRDDILSIVNRWYKSEQEEMRDPELTILVVLSSYIRLRAHPDDQLELMTYASKMLRHKIQWLEAGV